MFHHILHQLQNPASGLYLSVDAPLVNENINERVGPNFAINEHHIEDVG